MTASDAAAAKPTGWPPHQDNNFDFLRWCAATLVVLGHSPVLLGRENVLVWGIPISIFGVLIFFSISGYLVTESWSRDARPGPFFRKRGLRIFPALIVCVAMSMVVLGPAMTDLTLEAYSTDAHTWSYLLNCILRMQHVLPGVFARNPVPGLVNGSLWTLPIEFFCYAAVCVIGILSGHRAIWAASMTISIGVMLAISAYVFTFLHNGPPVVVYATDLGAASRLMPCFFAGSVFFRFRNRLTMRLDVALLLSLAMTIAQSLALWRSMAVLGYIAIPYIVITAGVHGTRILDRRGRRGDFSYGLYLYAFPIQQMLIRMLGPGIPTAGLFLLSELAAMALAVVSWHLVEKPTLSLRRPRSRSGGPAGSGSREGLTPLPLAPMPRRRS